MSMTTSRPYLLRALYEWILDNNLTPYAVIDAEDEHSRVPLHLVQNGTIVFNLSPDAVGQLEISNETIQFDASFSGIVQRISAPTHAVMAIYAHENGSGMMFHETSVPGEEADEKNKDKPKAQKESAKKTQKPQLRIVKDTDSSEE